MNPDGRFRPYSGPTPTTQTQINAALHRLTSFGLIERGRDWARRTTRTLNQVADAHQVAEWRAERIERFQRERAASHRLIAQWNASPADER